jgi:hypothetical protein
MHSNAELSFLEVYFSPKEFMPGHRHNCAEPPACIIVVERPCEFRLEEVGK